LGRISLTNHYLFGGFPVSGGSLVGIGTPCLEALGDKSSSLSSPERLKFDPPKVPKKQRHDENAIMNKIPKYSRPGKSLCPFWDGFVTPSKVK